MWDKKYELQEKYIYFTCYIRMKINPMASNVYTHGYQKEEHVLRIEMS